MWLQAWLVEVERPCAVCSLQISSGGAGMALGSLGLPLPHGSAQQSLRTLRNSSRMDLLYCRTPKLPRRHHRHTAPSSAQPPANPTQLTPGVTLGVVARDFRLPTRSYKCSCWLTDPVKGAVLLHRGHMVAVFGVNGQADT